MTQRQVYNILTGYGKAKQLESETKELEIKTSWLQTRKIAFAVVKPYLAKKYKKMKEEEFMPFAFEDDVKPRLKVGKIERIDDKKENTTI